MQINALFGTIYSTFKRINILDYFIQSRLRFVSMLYQSQTPFSNNYPLEINIWTDLKYSRLKFPDFYTNI